MSCLIYILQDAWKQYEQGAERLVDDLAAAFAKQDQQQELAAVAAGRVASTSTGSALKSENSTPEGAVCPTHQLMKALAVMDHVAASLDPDQLTGMR
jgi:hypothetical protein